MKTFILFTLFFGMALAAVFVDPAAPTYVEITQSRSDYNPDGSYVYSFETSDGSKKEETGVVKNAGTDEAYVAQSGYYKYFDADGNVAEVHYTADENGFVPTGNIIPEEISAAARAAAVQP